MGSFSAAVLDSSYFYIIKIIEIFRQQVVSIKNVNMRIVKLIIFWFITFYLLIMLYIKIILYNVIPLKTGENLDINSIFCDLVLSIIPQIDVYGLFNPYFFVVKSNVDR